MRLKEIKIEHFGKIDSYKVKLNKGITVIQNENADDIILALKEGLKYPDETFSEPNLSGKLDTHISIQSDSNLELTRLNDINLVSGSEEALKCKVFGLNGQYYSKRLLAYKKCDEYYDRSEFDWQTNRYGHLKVFRTYLCEYINHFKPVVLSKDKDLMINIHRSGEFYITKEGTEGYLLSSHENTLFEFFCYIELNKFWDGFAELCSPNVPKLPLLVCNFLEKLDNDPARSVDFIRSSIESNRQMIIISDSLTLPNYGTLLN